MNGQLVLHCGARRATREEIVRTAELVPRPTDTWVPVPHHHVLETVETMLFDAGFAVANQQYALHGPEKMFATLDIESEIVDGVSLVVGVRNSFNKTFPMGFAAGNRVFICDNTSFSAELLIARKHSRNGAERYREAIGHAVKSLDGFQKTEARRLTFMQECVLPQYEAEAWLLKAFEEDILSARSLPVAINAYRNPPVDWGPRERLYHAWNAITYALQPKAKSNPQRFSLTTQRLLALMFPKTTVGFDSLPDDFGYLIEEAEIDVTS